MHLHLSDSLNQHAKGIVASLGRNLHDAIDIPCVIPISWKVYDFLGTLSKHGFVRIFSFGFANLYPTPINMAASAALGI